MSIVRGALIWRDPFVAYSAQMESPASLMAWIGNSIADKRAIFLPLIAWSVEAPESARKLAELAQKYTHAHPNHKIIHMCNTQAEVEMLRSLGQSAEWFNHNAFVDPATYQLGRSAEKIFDAIYNAQLQSWKRHCLASKIASVAFIYHSYAPQQEAYRQEIKREVAGACFANHELAIPIGRSLLKREVQDLLSRSKVGLCLSQTEGAMHSSIEYLLAGLPVVSTLNKGGRDEFFEPAFTRIVEPNAMDVAAACYELIERKCAPEEIRAATIVKQQAVIARFQQFINKTLNDEGVQINIQEKWSGIYQDKLLGWETADQFLKRL